MHSAAGIACLHRAPKCSRGSSPCRPGRLPNMQNAKGKELEKRRRKEKKLHSPFPSLGLLMPPVLRTACFWYKLTALCSASPCNNNIYMTSSPWLKLSQGNVPLCAPPHRPWIKPEMTQRLWRKSLGRDHLVFFFCRVASHRS